jgi:hypothetical protein
MDPVIAGIEPQHYLAEAYAIPARRSGGLHIQQVIHEILIIRKINSKHNVSYILKAGGCNQDEV